MDEKQKIEMASDTGAYTIATSVVAMVVKGLTTAEIAANMERVIKETEKQVPKVIQDSLLAVQSEWIHEEPADPSTVVTPDAPKTEGFKFA